MIPLGARLGHPIWRRALKDAGVAEPVASEVVQRISDSYVGWQENSFPGLLGNVAAGRIANRLDLGGTNCVVDAACASSLGAVHLALMELAAGRCDVALTGGLDTFNDIFMYMCFSKTPALSPTGDARPFSMRRRRHDPGRRAGRPDLEAARRRPARRRPDLRGHQGRRLLQRRQGERRLRPQRGRAGQVPPTGLRVGRGLPETVELVEAHGTGTKVGDAVELSALAEVYRSARSRRDLVCPGLGQVADRPHQGGGGGGGPHQGEPWRSTTRSCRPRSRSTARPKAPRPARRPFYVNTEPRPWLPSPDHPRRAAVSAFGFGGSNFHCVLEEADPEPAAVAWDGDVQILAYSGARPRGDPGHELEAIPADPTWDQSSGPRPRPGRDPAFDPEPHPTGW